MSNKKGVIELLSQMVAIDSQSHNGNEAIISFLSQLFEGYEQTTQTWVREMDDVKGKNLIVKVPGVSSEHSLVFICHTDTVPTSDAWETDPFILEEQEGNLFGLGAVDTKGGVASLIHAVLTLEGKPAYDTYLVFDGDEEVQFTGARKYKKYLNLKNPHFIAVEPTDQNVCIGARSSVAVEVITYGKSQHASFGTPELNEAQSAVYKMHRVMGAVIEDAKELAKETDPVMGSNSQNLGVIHGGTADNVIPNKCVMMVDRRLLPAKNLKEELARLDALIHQADKDATTRVQLGEQGFQTSTASPLVAKALAVMQSKYPQAQPTCFTAMSEASMFQDKGDIIVWGPGSISLAHKANEYVSAQEVLHFVDLYKTFLQEIQF